jgi:nicotinate-nucleotide adenylyltransferase
VRILIYGGGFNPPHLGHRAALMTAQKALKPDRTLVIPDGMPPHKLLPDLTPDKDMRLLLCMLNFAFFPDTEISKIAIYRDGPCYMFDTLRLLRSDYPEDELILLLGGDMLLTVDQWFRSDELLQQCSLAALCRKAEEGSALREKAAELERRGVRVSLLEHEPVAVSSSKIRSLLPNRQGRGYLLDAVYGEIIRHRLYGAKPELSWLREQVYAMLKPKRIPHVAGCEQTARCLAERWGLDPELAAEAGILHDMTKYWPDAEQLAYCDRMGIELDKAERQNPLLYHARTGAVAARELFGAPPEVCEAIRWHTTGRAGMSDLQKILYLADKIEPNRDYPGVKRVRSLAKTDLDAAMAESLRMTVEDIRERNLNVYIDTLEAYAYYASSAAESKEDYSC